ncbi:MAG: murein hydrolase activator EnvC family protein [Oscillospiraceae bacterium]
MDKKRKLFIRIVCIALAIIMAATVLVGILVSAYAAPTQSDLDALEQQHEQIEQRMQDIQSQINSLKYEQSAAIAKKEVLDERVRLTQDGIDNLTAQIEEYGVLIEEKEAEAAAAQEAEEEQWELYKIRMRAMEENGTISYYAIIFGASDFADMLFRIDAVSSIMEHDELLYEDLVEARHATEDAKTDLENTRQSMENTKLELIDQQAVLEQQVAEAQELISEINLSIEEQRELYNAASEEEDRLKDEIMEMEEALRNASTGVVGTGQFIWPSQASTYITSLFGPRSSPTAGASSNHKGIDIAGSGVYGTNVLAADGGTVLTSAYSSSYGNYITISHGNGYTTLYAHMSKRLVSAGDTVSQGDVIGLVGSTGISTAAHLHFEVWESGTRVNPLNFFDSSTYTISPNA